LVTKSGGSTDTATRHGKYYFDGYALTNTANPVAATLTASDNMSNSASIPAYLAKTAEAFAYDLDGNLTSDGRWNYTYDAENRLITMETISAAVTAGDTRRKLTFTYDYLGRRVQKLVQSGWNGSSTPRPTAMRSSCGTAGC
jgi:YD repeat-containing protein